MAQDKIFTYAYQPASPLASKWNGIFSGRKMPPQSKTI